MCAMPKNILWIDNDIPFIRPYVNNLRKRADNVDAVASLSEAEDLLERNNYDLVIVDVMVPTQNEREISDYPSGESDFGHQTGLMFYNRIKRRFGPNLPKVLVMTVRLDQDIKDLFVKSGLKQENFLTKYSVREIPRFLEKIDSIVSSS
jgi:CheY-like chemotaxis protein